VHIFSPPKRFSAYIITEINNNCNLYIIGLADALCTTVEWLKGESEDKSEDELLTYFSNGCHKIC